MRRSFAGLGICSLSIFADRPTRPKQSRVRMGRAVEYRDTAANLSHSLAKHRLNGRAFFYSGGKEVRVTRQTNRRLSRHQKLDEIRMTLRNFVAVRGILLEEICVVLLLFEFP